MSEVLARHSDEEWSEEYSTALTRRYLNLGDSEKAMQLLTEKLERIRNLENTVRKRLLFEEIIDICISGGEAFLPLLRHTMDAVLVLEDPSIKTQLLAESTRRFFNKGFIRDTQNLLQLTLSQVGSIESPWEQAEIYSRIALIYNDMKNERRAREYAEKAISEITQETAPPQGEEAAVKLGLTAENLLRLGFGQKALQITSLIEYLWIRAETLCRMAIASSNDSLIDRAYETASGVSSAIRRMTTLFQLDFLLAEAGLAGEVRHNLPLRSAEIAALPVLSADSFTSRLARLYLVLGDADNSEKTAGRIRDAYSRAAILVQLARYNEEKKRPQKSEALLEESITLARSAGQARDRILQDVADVYMYKKDTARAVITAAEIEEPYSFALTTAELVRYLLETKTPLDEETFTLMEKNLYR
jgi:tetratricopeptide (TPR) repeat protein